MGVCGRVEGASARPTSWRAGCSSRLSASAPPPPPRAVDVLPRTVNLRIMHALPHALQAKVLWCALRRGRPEPIVAGEGGVVVGGVGVGGGTIPCMCAHSLRLSALAPTPSQPTHPHTHAHQHAAAVADPLVVGYVKLYRIILENARPQLACALRLFVDRDNYPILVHCIHGVWEGGEGEGAAQPRARAAGACQSGVCHHPALPPPRGAQARTAPGWCACCCCCCAEWRSG